MSLELVDVAAREPSWPDAEERPLLFLLDASSALERRLLDAWIDRNRRPGPGDAVVDIPPSRRRRLRRPAVSVRLRQRLEDESDPLLVPLRVAWLAPERDGRRRASLLDLLAFGDPRDPSRLRQEWLVRRYPDRVHIVAGEAAPVSDLRTRWVDARTKSPDDPAGFAEFVAMQASLALERSERRIRGNRYKVPRFLAEDLLSRSSFQVGLLRLAETTGQTAEGAMRLAHRYLKEIAATHSTFVIDLMAALIRILYTQGYHRRIFYDRDGLRRIYELSQQHPLVFLPSHKSNLDHLVLMYVLYENGFPPNHTAGGINMNFFPVGPLVRRAGVFFIRRSFKDNEPYKFVLKRYLDFLLAKRFPLEWFIEGGRSRSGKMRAPRFGMLAYVADSFRRGSCDDVVLVPVSIAYDQIHDIGDYAAEQKGAAKQRESFGWFLRALRTMRRRYGRIHLNLGEPLSLAEALTPYRDEGGQPDESALEIQKLAFEVAVRINRVTPITPISLVTLALLGSRDRALTVDETSAVLSDYLDLVERRGLPVTEVLSFDTPEQVLAALEALREHGVVSRFTGGLETVYSIEPEQHLAAAYYRNTISHFFTTGAIVELALLAAAEGEGDPRDTFWDGVMALRDLLKFEFFFSDKEEFRVEVEAELADHVSGWEKVLAKGGDEVMAILRSVRPFRAHWVLRPFLEAYRVVADLLEHRDYRQEIEEKAFLEECLAVGKQYLLQYRIESPESVSTVLFETALNLSRNRGLLEAGGPERLEERRAFAAQIRDVIRRIDSVENLAAARRLGLSE
jgi:glycerol-3-phosphate O-acyltransferase